MAKTLNFWYPVSWEWITNIQDIQLNKQTPQTAWRGASNLFKDEQDIYNRMTNDWLDDTTARWLITKKRKTLLKDISQDEWKVLTQMQEDWLDSEIAVKVIREHRYKNLPLWKKALKIPFDASVAATWMATEQVWNVLDFATGWQTELWTQWREAREVAKRTTGDSIWAKIWETTLWAWEMLAVWPTKIASTLKWRALQWAAVWWAIWAWSPILEKGADVTPWEIVWGGLKWAAFWAAATPILEKAVLPILAWTASKIGKYWTAWIKGWAKWLWKSVARDVKRPFERIKLEWVAPKQAAKLSTKANRFNAKDIEDFKRITWESPWEFATKRGMNKVWDQAVDEATTLWKKSINEADDALKAIDWNYKIDKWTDYLWNMLDDLSWRLKKTLSGDSKKVATLLEKYKSSWLTMSEINDIKRLYSKNYKYSWLDAASENALRSKNLQDWVRKWQFKTAWEQWFKNLKDINKTTQGWKTFADSLAKKLKRSSWNNNISLTDWVALSWWEPTNVALFLGKKVWEMTPIKRALIKWLWKQTKPSIIKANKSDILKANKLKKDANVRNILRSGNRGSSDAQLALPAWKTKDPIRTQILPSKKPIKLWKSIETIRPKTTKTIIKKPQSLQKAKTSDNIKALDVKISSMVEDGNDYLKSMKLKEMSKGQEIRLMKAFQEWIDNPIWWKYTVQYNKELTKIAKENWMKEFSAEDFIKEMNIKKKTN